MINIFDRARQEAGSHQFSKSCLKLHIVRASLDLLELQFYVCTECPGGFRRQLNYCIQINRLRACTHRRFSIFSKDRTQVGAKQIRPDVRIQKLEIKLLLSNSRLLFSSCWREGKMALKLSAFKGFFPSSSKVNLDFTVCCC